MGDKGKQPLFMAVMDAARGCGLTPADRLLLAYLAYRQGYNADCWPGVRTIARDLGLSKNCIKESTERLRAARLIECTPGKPGRGHSHRYAICMAKRVTGEPFSCETKGSESNPFDGKKRVTPRPEKGHPVGQNHTRSIQKEKSTSSSRTKGTTYTEDFEHFWAEYPRKTGKMEAFREWQAIAPDEVLAGKIIVSVQAWKRSEQWTKDGGKFVVYPVRFLKHRRFEDELPCSTEEPVQDDYARYGTREATEEDIQRLQEAGVL